MTLSQNEQELFLQVQGPATPEPKKRAKKKAIQKTPEPVAPEQIQPAAPVQPDPALPGQDQAKEEDKKKSYSLPKAEDMDGAFVAGVGATLPWDKCSDFQAIRDLLDMAISSMMGIEISEAELHLLAKTYCPIIYNFSRDKDGNVSPSLIKDAAVAVVVTSAIKQKYSHKEPEKGDA